MRAKLFMVDASDTRRVVLPCIMLQGYRGKHRRITLGFWNWRFTIDWGEP